MTFNLNDYRFADGKVRAWTDLGCYPLAYYTADGGCLCAACVTSDGQTTDPHDPQWYVVGVDVHWEGDPLTCDHCNAEIESAYGPIDGDPTEGE